MYVGIYLFLDKAKVFDDYLARYFPKEEVRSSRKKRGVKFFEFWERSVEVFELILVV